MCEIHNLYDTVARCETYQPIGNFKLTFENVYLRLRVNYVEDLVSMVLS